ncbi:MAG TPA: hypothetical protein PL033_19760 [Candidatus Brocadiia bacterium]|nr:hypothetical protein [Candidatus Brocadiia bacterium]
MTDSDPSKNLFSPEGGITHELVLPCLLFMALGGMTWAVRGCSGYGGEAGCAFAGIAWATAWYYLARSGRRDQTRRYSLGWIVPLMTLGVAVSGFRGWMQWPSWHRGQLFTNYSTNSFVPINPAYGMLWLFIAGVPWAGLGAVGLAWCGSERPLSWKDWIIRLVFGFGAGWLGVFLFDKYPAVFLPLYDQVNYKDLVANPSLRRIINDNWNATLHICIYSGFLLYEIVRKDWRNVRLILIVGFVNGIGWALLRNWYWAANLWPEGRFNWWRCWESSGGISIGFAYGLAYYFCNRPLSDADMKKWVRHRAAYPNAERLAVYFGLVFFLAYAIKNGMKGWANIYIGNEDYWDNIFFYAMGIPAILLFCWLVYRNRRNPLPTDYEGDTVPHYGALMWTTLIILNVLAQLITGKHSNWPEVAFAIYYLLLFAITAVIIYYYGVVKKLTSRTP